MRLKGHRVALAVVVGAMTAGAPGIAEARDARPIAVLGGAAKAEIRLSPAGADRREGRTTLLVRNRTRQRLRLRVRYVLDDPSPTITAEVDVDSSRPRRSGA